MANRRPRATHTQRTCNRSRVLVVVTLLCGVIVATVAPMGTAHAQRVRLPDGFTLPDASPTPSERRGLSPDNIPLTDEGPADAPEPVVENEVVAPPPPPPPPEAVASPRFRDPRGRGQRFEIDLPRLRFLLASDFAPFNELDARGRPVGYHVALVRGLCEALDVLDRCQVQAMPWGSLRGALSRRDGEAIVAGIAVTPEAREALAFTGPYMRFPARFVTRRGEAFDPRGAGRVGVARATAHEAMLRALFPSLTPVPLADDAAVQAALAAGEVDAAFGDGARLAEWLAGEACCAFAGEPYFSEHFLGRGLSIAVRADDAELAAALDWALGEMEASGRLEEIYLRAFPVSFY